MNANPSRQSPAEWEESAQLLPPPNRDLPSGRHQFHKERLMARIQQEERTATATAAEPKARRFTMPRRAFAVPAMACALAGAVLVGASVFTSAGEDKGVAGGPALARPVGAATTKGVPQLLDQISLAAAEVPNPKAGQYVYIESKTANSNEKIIGDKAGLDTGTLHTRQVWQSLDGTKGWLIDPTVNPEGETLSTPDAQGNVPVATLNGPSYNYLAKLTTDPDKLLKKIYKETEGKGDSPDQEAFEAIGDLLGESYPPAELYSALFKTAAKIPGVVMVEDAVDAAGRHGVAVARLDETSGNRTEWIFDRKTHEFLGERSVHVGEDDGVIKRGTVLSTSAIMKRAVVDDIKQTPTEAG
ncbi:CU044_5270 family protein [Streptomyces sp. NPDC018000]|uniref:CU044_5270 family protein n=1 Tax=Streptomyces sp. NPDC018000 TaxID=3365028 RepID=UPI0037B1CE0E